LSDGTKIVLCEGVSEQQERKRRKRGRTILEGNRRSQNRLCGENPIDGDL
jgi:hypothetical protein